MFVSMLVYEKNVKGVTFKICNI